MVLLSTSDHLIAKVAYLHNRRTAINLAGFEPATPTIKRPQTYTLDLTATGIGFSYTLSNVMLLSVRVLFPMRYSSVYLQASVSQTVLVLETFWLRKITAGTHILANINITDARARYRVLAAGGSPGICHFSFLSDFHE